MGVGKGEVHGFFIKKKKGFFFFFFWAGYLVSCFLSLLRPLSEIRFSFLGGGGLYLNSSTLSYHLFPFSFFGVFLLFSLFHSLSLR